jgi:hypothetical protein
MPNMEIIKSAWPASRSQKRPKPGHFDEESGGEVGNDTDDED